MHEEAAMSASHQALMKVCPCDLLVAMEKQGRHEINTGKQCHLIIVWATRDGGLNGVSMEAGPNTAHPSFQFMGHSLDY